MARFAFLAFLFLAVTVSADTAQNIQKIQKSSSLMESGDLKGASSLLQQVLQEEPQSGPAHLLMGEINLQQFQWAEAEKYLKTATTLSTRRPYLPWQLLGKLYLLKHEYSSALNAFENSLQQQTTFEPALFGRAKANLFLRKIDAAIADLKQVNAAEAKYLLAEVFLYQGKSTEARQQLESLPKDFAASAWLLRVLQNAQDARLPLEEDLGSGDAYFASAVQLRQKGDRAKSDALLQIAYQLDDQNPAPFLFSKDPRLVTPKMLHPELIAKIADLRNSFDQKNFSQAKQTAAEVIDACKYCVPAYLSLIDIAEMERKYWDVLEQYKRIDRWLPDLPGVLTRIAGVEREMGAFASAECTIRGAISTAPKNGSLYYLLATIQQQNNQQDLAIVSCKKAIELGYDQAPVYVLLGNLYYEKMDLPNSMAAMEKAMSLDPQSAEHVASFALAELTTKNHPELQASLEKFAESHPDSINTIYALGFMYFNEGNLDKAKSYFQRLQKLVQGNSQVYYNLGLIYSREGNSAEAEKAMNRFRQLKQQELQEFNAANEAFRMRHEAQSALKAGDSAKAVSLFSKLVTGRHSEQSDYLGLAKAYQAQKDKENAYSCYLKILTVSPANKDALHGAMETADTKELAAQWRHRLELVSTVCTAGFQRAPTKVE